MNLYNMIYWENQDVFALCTEECLAFMPLVVTFYSNVSTDISTKSIDVAHARTQDFHEQRCEIRLNSAIHKWEAYFPKAVG